MPVTEEAPSRHRLPQLGGTQPLPEFAVPLAPKPVAQASEGFRVRLAQLEHAHHQERQAADAVSAAEVADADNARKAAASTVKVGAHPKATAPAARERHEEAKRAVPAYEHHARVALDEYVAAIREHRQEIDELADEREVALLAQAAAKLDDIEQLLLQRVGIGALRGALNPPPEGRNPMFAVRLPRRLPSELAKPIEALRSGR